MGKHRAGWSALRAEAAPFRPDAGRWEPLERSHRAPAIDGLRCTCGTVAFSSAPLGARPFCGPRRAVVAKPGEEGATLEVTETSVVADVGTVVDILEYPAMGSHPPMVDGSEGWTVRPGGAVWWRARDHIARVWLRGDPVQAQADLGATSAASIFA